MSMRDLQGHGVDRMCVLLVEDEPSVREGIATMLLATGDFEVAAACGLGGEALRLLKDDLSVDLALVDLRLPDVPGVEVLLGVRRLRPHALALALTVFDDDASIFGALRAGAHGYLLKGDAPERLLQAVYDAMSGGAALSVPVARRLVGTFWPEPGFEVPRLTPREQELLELLHLGYTYEEAARTMKVGLGTVQGYVKTLYTKLGATSKVEAVRMGIRDRLLQP